MAAYLPVRRILCLKMKFSKIYFEYFVQRIIQNAKGDFFSSKLEDYSSVSKAYA